MTLLEDPSKRKKDDTIAQMSLYAAVPFLLIAAPLIGFFGGQWLDGKCGTEPYLTVVGVVLGFGAAAREIYNIIKRAQRMGNGSK
jgi:F0F1-type ATP synthase assembly protein I